MFKADIQHKLNYLDSARLWREQIFYLCQNTATVMLEFTLYIWFHSQKSKQIQNLSEQTFAMITCLKYEKKNYKTYTLRGNAYDITDNCACLLYSSIN